MSPFFVVKLKKQKRKGVVVVADVATAIYQMKRKIDWEEVVVLTFLVLCAVLIVVIVACGIMGIDIGSDGGFIPVMIGSQMYLLPT